MVIRLYRRSIYDRRETGKPINLTLNQFSHVTHEFWHGIRSHLAMMYAAENVQ